MINVEVEKKTTENTANIVRRFTKRMRESGILMRMRKIRYHTRKTSKFLKKKGALKRLSKKQEYEKLIKLGKISENPRYRRRF